MGAEVAAEVSGEAEDGATLFEVCRVVWGGGGGGGGVVDDAGVGTGTYDVAGTADGEGVADVGCGR